MWTLGLIEALKYSGHRTVGSGDDHMTTVLIIVAIVLLGSSIWDWRAAGVGRRILRTRESLPSFTEAPPLVKKGVHA